MINDPGPQRKRCDLPFLKIKRFTLRQLIYMALCSDLGIVCKKLTSPFANIITDSLHVPGGIGTAFSISFIVIAAVLINRFGAGMLMSIIQCITAFAIGSVGNMGALSIIAYFFPGLVIDVVCLLADRFKLGRQLKAFLSCTLASVTACIVANALVFDLSGVVLGLYCSIGAFAGALGGLFSITIIERLVKVYPKEDNAVREGGGSVNYES